MMFRRKLLGVFALTVFLSVAAVALLVSAVTRRAFDRSEDERSAALVTQFQREFNRQGEDVARRVERIAASEEAGRMALKLNRSRSTLTSGGFSLNSSVLASRELAGISTPRTGAAFRFRSRFLMLASSRRFIIISSRLISGHR